MVSLCAYARHISEDEAAAIATEFLNSTTVRQTPTKTAVHRAKAPNATEAGTAPFYVFNADNSQGFVIVSADDRAQRILGYSDKGTFDFTNLPPQLEAILDSCEMNLAHLPEIPHASWKAQSYAVTSVDDGIVLKTADWGQGYPYNLCTPEVDGQHCPTGCVATAMAIVMKYNKWPGQARGGIQKWTSNATEMSLEFDEFSFDFDNMPGNYAAGEFSDAQAMEVSRLMQAAGASVKTEYGIDASGANNWPIGHCMFENFSYSPDAQYIQMTNFSEDEWMNIIKEQIGENHLVVLTGVNYNTNVGHAFVCDGYDSEDFLHINWGWDGVNNGYFEPFLLGGFNWNIGMATNLYPDAVAEPTEYSPHFIDATGNISRTYKSVENVRQNEPFNVHLATVHLAGSKPTGHFSVALTDASGKLIEIWNYESIYPVYVIDQNWGSAPEYKIENIIFKSEILPDYRLQIVELLDNDVCKIVLGTEDSPSSIPACGFDCDMGSVCYQIDDSDNIIKGKDYLQNFIIPKGSFICKEISVSDGVAAIYIDGQYMGAIDGFSSSMLYNFRILNNRHDVKIIAKKYSKLISKSYDVDVPGTLSDLISAEDQTKLYKLTISGNVSVADLHFIASNLHYVRHLDLKDATIIASEYNRQNFFPGIFNEGDGAHIILWDLDNIILPDNLEGFEDGALHLRYGHMPVIGIPKSLNHYGSATLLPRSNFCFRIAKIDNPVPTDEENGLFLPIPELRSLVILYVPEGSKEAYENSPAWQGFMDIRESNAPYVGHYVIDNHYRYTAFTDFAVVSGVSYFDDAESRYLIVPNNIEIETKRYPVRINTIETLQLYLTETENFELHGQVWNLISNKLNQDYTRTLYDGYFGVDVLWVPGASEDNHKLAGYVTKPMWDCRIDKTKKLLKIKPFPYLDNAMQVEIDGIKINGSPISIKDDGLYSFESLDNLTIEVLYSISTNWNDRLTKECLTSTIYTPDFIGRMESTHLGIPCQSIEISFDGSSTLQNGETLQLTATVFPENATYNSVSWTSSDNAIATVDAEGLVTAHNKNGTATITATATDESGVAASCDITVRRFVSSISLYPSFIGGTEGEHIQIDATVLPEDATYKVIRWSSSDESIAKVNKSGLISLLKKGTAVITASATDGSGVSAECAVVVTEYAGIKDILTDKGIYVKIFNLQGIKVYEGIYSEANLAPDYYIVVCDGKNVKVKVE